MGSWVQKFCAWVRGLKLWRGFVGFKFLFVGYKFFFVGYKFLFVGSKILFVEFLKVLGPRWFVSESAKSRGSGGCRGLVGGVGSWVRG